MKSLLRYECVRQLYEEFDHVNSIVYDSIKIDRKKCKKSNRIKINRLIQKEKLKKRVKQRKSNVPSNRRDTLFSAKRLANRNRRYRTITASPIDCSQNGSIEKNFSIDNILHTGTPSNKLNTYMTKKLSKVEQEISLRAQRNETQKQRMNSYCISPMSTLSVGKDVSQNLEKPPIRYSNITSFATPLHETFQYLKSKLHGKGSFTGTTRHRSNKRSTYGASTACSKITSFTSSEMPLSEKDLTTFRIGKTFSKIISGSNFTPNSPVVPIKENSRRSTRKRVSKNVKLKPKVRHRFSAQPPQPVKAVRVSWLN
ncbi:unnamed protein product [Moneuplotes crassus]|uniref:Uncharacterized protein n=1 Tax=Euplotes crassus TaxID=5936 RepID=A0AAD2CY50_EUPCR|nr:unnamed protein product [Moneuplotes crassus]